LLSRSIVFDTSVLLNLLAASQTGSIIRSVCSEGLICSAVASETLFIRSERIRDPPELVDLKPLLEAHILKICNLEAIEEYDSYVRYAMDLDDGEAMSLAICAARGYAIATDDRKARQIAGRSPEVEAIGTSEILHYWVTFARPDEEQIRGVVRRIEVCARFRPTASDPLRTWWEAYR
jgi:predicted nucleic acid-binding protein